MNPVLGAFRRLSWVGHATNIDALVSDMTLFRHGSRDCLVKAARRAFEQFPIAVQRRMARALDAATAVR
jgi:hypothetical protein